MGLYKPVDIVHNMGDKNNAVMSQKAVTEILEQFMVDNATIVQAPRHVDSLDKMTDTSRVYVLTETGHIWAYMDTTVEKEVTVSDEITGGYERGRLSSSGTNSADVQTHTLTPFIDLTKAEYQGKTIQINLEGNRYVSESDETYIMMAIYDANKNVLLARGYTTIQSGNGLDAFKDAVTTEIHGTTSATISIAIPAVHKGTGTTIGYLRFCGQGTVNGNVSITYKTVQTVTGGQWVDTGTTYAPTLTESDKQEMVESIVDMIDTDLLSVIGNGVIT